MDLKDEFKFFVSSLNEDFIIGKQHLIDDIPFKLTAPDFLYFYSLKDVFWPNISLDKRLTVSVAMTELYISVLLHIYSSEYEFNEDVHHLEHSILYGDLLSGAFSEKLVQIDEIGILKDWLELLQDVHKDLVKMSLDKKDIVEKKMCLVHHIIDVLVPSDDKDDYFIFAKKMLVEEDNSNVDDRFAGKLSQFIKQAFKREIVSSDDFLAFMGE